MNIKQIENNVLKRDPKYHAICGDIWRLNDGRYLLVDYKDPFQTGFTCSDGFCGAFNYTYGFELYLTGFEAKIFITGEDTKFPWADQNGWSKRENAFTAQDSVDFIHKYCK